MTLENHILPLTETERQIVLMALAVLSSHRPGFEPAAKMVANKIDIGGLLFQHFKENYEAPKPPTLVISDIKSTAE